MAVYKREYPRKNMSIKDKMFQLSKPWKGICSHGCWYAKKKRCKCKCKGVYHQQGLALQRLPHQKRRITNQALSVNEV